MLARPTVPASWPKQTFADNRLRNNRSRFSLFPNLSGRPARISLPACTSGSLTAVLQLPPQRMHLQRIGVFSSDFGLKLSSSCFSSGNSGAVWRRRGLPSSSSCSGKRSTDGGAASCPCIISAAINSALKRLPRVFHHSLFPTKCSRISRCGKLRQGARGFEPPTSWSQTTRSTIKLRPEIWCSGVRTIPDLISLLTLMILTIFHALKRHLTKKRVGLLV